jgi:hypothetical protein
MSDLLNMEYLLLLLWKFFSPSMPKHGGVHVGRIQGPSSLDTHQNIKHFKKLITAGHFQMPKLLMYPKPSGQINDLNSLMVQPA